MTAAPSIMSDVNEYLRHATLGIGLVGVAVIMFGVLVGMKRFLWTELAAARGDEVEPDRRRLRQALGYHLLLGLEFLIAADIIDTLATPGPAELISLGAIVLIRALISYSLSAELSEQAAQAVRNPSS